MAVVPQLLRSGASAGVGPVGGGGGVQRETTHQRNAARHLPALTPASNAPGNAHTKYWGGGAGACSCDAGRVVGGRLPPMIGRGFQRGIPQLAHTRACAAPRASTHGAQGWQRRHGRCANVVSEEASGASGRYVGGRECIPGAPMWFWDDFGKNVKF